MSDRRAKLPRKDNVTHDISQRWQIGYDRHLIRYCDYKGGKIDLSSVPLRLPFDACTFPGFFFVATCLTSHANSSRSPLPFALHGPAAGGLRASDPVLQTGTSEGCTECYGTVRGQRDTDRHDRALTPQHRHMSPDYSGLRWHVHVRVYLSEAASNAMAMTSATTRGRNA